MKYALELLAETSLIILHFPISLLNLILSNKISRRSRYQNPIIIVQRWIDINPLHLVMKNYLQSKGFTVYNINLPLLRGTFLQSSDKLKQFIEEKRLSNITLIGISAGGLTCYEYLTHHNGWEKVNKFISVGTPFQGATLGFFLAFSDGGRELRPKSPYIQSILKKPILNHDKIYCIGAKYDEMVGHKNSFLPGAKSIIVDVAGHNLLHTLWLPTLKKIEDICLSQT